MQRHYLQSVDIREAMVAGRLLDVHRSASVLAADDWSPELRRDYAPYVTALRDRARAVAAAPSLAESVTALGAMGEACADCHRRSGGPGSNLPPTILQGYDPAMVEHAAAADALWQGLVGPSDALWTAGARTLVDAPALDSEAPDVAAAARQLRAEAQRALSAPPGKRASVLADVLLTCASCHEALGAELPRPAFYR